jgi:hypothetical protein
MLYPVVRPVTIGTAHPAVKPPVRVKRRVILHVI